MRFFDFTMVVVAMVVGCAIAMVKYDLMEEADNEVVVAVDQSFKHDSSLSILFQ
jgi:hypothetical protein